MRRELDRRFTESFFAWTPNLYSELGQALEQEERTLIEAGAIQATGFVYVGVCGPGPLEAWRADPSSVR
jgi:hypothetical protein